MNNQPEVEELFIGATCDIPHVARRRNNGIGQNTPKPSCGFITHLFIHRSIGYLMPHEVYVHSAQGCYDGGESYE